MNIPNMVLAATLGISIFLGGNNKTNHAYFTTEPLSEAEVQEHLSTYDFVALSSEVESTGIDCFDVGENGWVALGFSSPDVICVYNQAGTFLYGYTFNCDGSFGVEIKGESLIVYITRGDVAVTLDRTGECLGVVGIPDTRHNNTKWNEVLHCTKRVVNGRIYELEKDWFLSTEYSKLVVSDGEGETHIFYNCATGNAFYTIFTIWITASIIIVSVIGIRKLFHKQKE